MLLDSTGIQLYQAITGSLLFSNQCNRFDITYAVKQLARVTNKPSKLHMTDAKHLFRHLKGDMGPVITYKTVSFETTGFFDASWEITVTMASQPVATCSCWLEGH